MIFYAILWAYKFRVIIIFINLKSNIRVGTCLCTHATAFEFFCIEWFDSNSKEDSKSFENALKYLKGKRKRVSFLSLALGL
jgi:hypothetical protein